MKWVVGALMLMVATPLSTHAAIVITKIVSNPLGANAGRQWVEISNTGPEPLDLGAKTIRFFTTSGNHLIKAYAGGSTVVPAGGTAVIAQNPLAFLFDEPNYAGLLVKSSFTLPASGIVGITQTDGTVLARSSYTAVVATKPVAVSKSTTKRATSHTTTKSTSQKSTKSSAHSYGKGTTAPSAAASAAAEGATFTWPAVLAPLVPVFGTVWFAAYLALLAFSGFSLLVIQRYYYI